MNKHKIAALLFVLLFISCGTGSLINAQTLQADLDNIIKQIKVAEADSAKYSGGLIKTLIDSRIELLKNTKAMLEQRVIAQNNSIQIKYTIDGKGYLPLPNKEEILKQIESEAVQAIRDRDTLQKDADQYSGGLIKVTKLASVALKDQELAMLEMRRIAILYDIPFYVGSNQQDSQPRASASQANAITPQAQESELDKLITLSLLRTRVFEYNYSDHLGLEMSYTNNADKEIRAFTGIVYFKDVFDREILKIGLTVDSYKIKPGQAVIDKGKSIELNKFDSNHSKLKGTSIENLHVSFEVTAIIFADGSKLGEIK
jgi:hypothetical protein